MTSTKDFAGHPDLGLGLRNPLVASASPLSNSVDGVRRLADADVGAVVLYSLFAAWLPERAAAAW
jgi:dihydroorotate dehydrogenase (fumarate)